MRSLKKIIALLITMTMLLSMFTVVSAAAPAYLPGTYSRAAIKVNPVSGISNDFIMGADVSMLKDIEENGGKYYNDSGNEQDCLQILKDHGVNWIRLRIWNDPTTDANGFVGNDQVMINGKAAPEGTPGGAGTCDEAHTIATALKAKALGMKVLLDFHYSDFWADPAKQSKPKAWRDKTGKDLQDAVYDYTKKVLTDMKAAATASLVTPGETVSAMPDMVQIGNENNNGMLWPEGNSGKGFAGWIGLNNAAIKAVREVGGKSTKIMIHLADGGSNTLYRKTFDIFTDVTKEAGYDASSDTYSSSLVDYNGKAASALDFDVIGLSYYAFWHGKMSTFKANINDLAVRYGKEIAVAELGYGFTFENGDSQTNAFAEGSELVGGYQATVQGQAQYIRDVIDAVSQVKDSSGNKTGLGVFYWEPEWIPVKDAKGNTLVGWINGGGDDSENRALFDFNGNALPSLDAFNDVKKDPGQVSYTAAVTKLVPASKIVSASETPALPDTVQAYYTDGSIRDVSVAWDNIDASQLQKLHTFTVYGTVSGTDLRAQAEITVIGLKNRVTNPGFETGNSSNWNVSKDSGTMQAYVENSTSNAYTGSYVFTYYTPSDTTGFTVEQTITGLPNGNYTLKVVSHGQDKGTVNRYLYAKDYGGAEKDLTFANTAWREFKFPEIKNIKVTNGQCTIGVKMDTAGAGTWGKLDDFELYADTSTATLSLPANIALGTTFNAKLSYSNLIYNIYAQDITINYDSTKLDFVSSKAADSNNTILSTKVIKPGTVRILAANAVKDGISCNAEAMYLTFTAKSGVSASDITISKADLATSDGTVVNPNTLLTTLVNTPMVPDTTQSTSTTATTTTSAATPAASEIKIGSDGKVTVQQKPVLDPVSGTASVAISLDSVKNALNQAKADNKGVKEFTLEVPDIKGAKVYSQELPKIILSQEKASNRIDINTPIATVKLPGNMLGASEAGGSDKVTVSVGKADISAMESGIRSLIGNRPVIDLNLSAGGKVISWSNADAPVTVEIPYTPGTDELKASEHLTVYYIDGQRNVVPVTNAKYNAEKGKIVFTTTRFSKYAVAFVNKTFTDVKAGKWFAKPVEVLASKGIVKGTSETAFSPDSKITRGEFIEWLVKTLGLTAKYNTNFSDISKTDSCYDALGIAKALGITSGTGANRYNAAKEISRQDMMVLTIKALKAADIELAAGSSSDISRFSDASKISKYAAADVKTMVRAGLISGNGRNVNPTGAVTRAESAQVLYKILVSYM